EAVRKVDWMHAVSDVVAVVDDDPTAVREEHHESWISFKAQIVYGKVGEKVSCWDYGQGKRYAYFPLTKTVAMSELRRNGSGIGAGTPFGYAEGEIQMQLDRGGELIRRREQRDQMDVEIWEIAGPSDDGIAMITLVIDVERHLPIAAEIEHTSEGGRTNWSTAFKYPQSGPSSIYDLGVPRMARVIDRTMVPIGTPGDEPRAVPTPGQPPRSKQVPIDIKLPRPMFVGTPENFRVPRLAKPRGRPRPPFFAPPGTRNVALGKRVSASDEDPIIGSAELITDGDKEAGDGSFVEFGPSVQHVTIDLGAEHEIYAVVVWHYHKQARVYFDVVVQVSDDRDFGRNVWTLFNNDIDNSVGFGAGTDLHYTETNEGKLIDARGVRARYVRLYSNGNTSEAANHYIEVEVYGR
ncbi:MAG: discoidin domain-containing protein, partial [Phycisphaerales bacterium]